METHLKQFGLPPPFLCRNEEILRCWVLQNIRCLQTWQNTKESIGFVHTQACFLHIFIDVLFSVGILRWLCLFLCPIIQSFTSVWLLIRFPWCSFKSLLIYFTYFKQIIHSKVWLWLHLWPNYKFWCHFMNFW
jgi:hypothetical protein